MTEKCRILPYFSCMVFSTGMVGLMSNIPYSLGNFIIASDGF